MSFWAAAAIAFLVFAANAAASPLYRIYQAQFRFSATTLTLLFAVYIVVLLLTLLFFGSVSDYVGRRPVMLAGLAVGCGRRAACSSSRTGSGCCSPPARCKVSPLACISGAASAALLDLRPDGSATPVVSSAAPTGGQALGAIGASALAQYAPAPTHLVWWLLLGGVRHRRRRGAGDARAGNGAPRRCELTAAAGQRAARGQRRLRHGGARPGGNRGHSPASTCRWDRHLPRSCCTRRICSGAAS